MKYRTKFFIFSTSLVVLTTIVLIGGASYITVLQTKGQNEIRLKNAFQFLNDAIEKRHQAIQSTVTGFIQDSALTYTSFKYIVNEYPVGSASARKFKVNLYNLGNEAGVGKLAFYYSSKLGNTPPSLNYIFDQSLNALVKINPPEKVNIEANNSTMEAPFMVEKVVNGFIQREPIEYTPLFANTISPDPTVHLRIDESDVHYVHRFLYSNTYKKRKDKDPQTIGYFQVDTPLFADLDSLGNTFGVHFNLYDHQGVAGQGVIAMPNLDLEQLQNQQDAIWELHDLQGNTHDTLVMPLTLDGKTIGYISAQIPIAETTSRILESIQWLSVFAMIILLVASFFSYVLISSISTPITNLTGIVENIAAGDGDLTQRIEIDAKGEIGELAHWFNQFIAQVHEIVSKVEKDAHTLASSSEELSMSTEEMKQNSNSISKAIHEEATAANQSSQTITEMVRSLESMFTKIKSIQNRANDAENRVHEAQEVVRQTNETMSHIEQSRQEIQNATGVITEIANQINLLSLNAAIESAKAGDLGKGFAVVADEIRHLAERSSAAVIDIQASMENSGKSVEEGTKVVQKAQVVLNHIIEQIREISGSLNNISSEINEQEAGIQDVSKSVTTISQLSDENASAAKELTQSLQEIALTTGELSQIAGTLTSKVELFKI